MHYPSDRISHAGALHLTPACMGVIWGCWLWVAWPTSPRPTDTQTHIHRAGSRARASRAWNLTPRNTDLVSGFSYLVNLYVPASLAVMVPLQTKMVSDSGCEASTGKHMLSALRNCRNNEYSLEKSTSSGAGGRVQVFLWNTRRVAEATKQVVTQAAGFPWGGVQTWACLSLLNTLLHWHEADPDTNTQRVGSSVNAWSIGMHSRLVCQLLAAGHLNVLRYCCQQLQGTHKYITACNIYI